jgi:hypothetical protein
MPETFPLEAQGVDAFEIGSLARRALRPGLRGALSAVFQRSFYIRLADQEICLGTAALGAGPLNLRCRLERPDWHASGLREGAAVLVTQRALRLPPNLSVSLARAVIWKPQAPVAWSEASLRAGLQRLDAALCGRIPEQGLGVLALPSTGGEVLPAVAAAALGPVEALAGHLHREFAHPSADPVPGIPDLRALIGLGPGLTPSGDDLLGGALVALHILRERRLGAALWTALRRHIEADANAITRAHLAAAAQGLGSAALHDILNDVLTGTTPALPQRIAAIDAIGHTSGWDALAGALVVLRAYTNRP